MYYIYSYIDPRTNLPFYIGKGKNDRKFNHLNESPSKKENKEKFQIIQELQLLGMLPIIVELESCIDNELLAYNREDYYILKYGRKGIEPNGILTNKIIGGKHPPTPKWDIDRKKKHSDWNKNYWTTERRNLHKPIDPGVGMVVVTDKLGNSKRIDKAIYDSMDKTSNMATWEFVPVSSNESKKRRNTLRTVT